MPPGYQMHKYLALLLVNEHCSQSANIEVDSTTLLQVQIQDYYTIGYSLLQDGTLLSAVLHADKNKTTISAKICRVQRHMEHF